MSLQQLPLFWKNLPLPPNSRAADPVTSHEAGEEITANGKRAEQADTVLAMLRTRPGLTAAELAEQFRADRYMVARRLPDLRDAGQANNGSLQNPTKRRCRVSGKLALLWFPEAR